MLLEKRMTNPESEKRRSRPMKDERKEPEKMSEELKACKICKNRTIENNEYASVPPGQNRIWYCYSCSICGFTSESSLTRKGALERWNSHPEPKQDWDEDLLADFLFMSEIPL